MSGTLTWRGLDLRSALADPDGVGLRFNVTDGFLAPPDARGSDYVVAARRGRRAGNRIADTLKNILTGRVTAAESATWRDLTDELLAVLGEDFDVAPGDLVAGDGYLGLAAGATATLTARVKNFIPGRVLTGAGGAYMQTWSIELEAVSPAWIVTGP